MEAIAELNIKSAVALMGLDWVTKAVLSFAPLPPPVKQKRGRKPGTPPSDDKRCTWILRDNSQCKNSRVGEGAFCKMHEPKHTLIDGGDA